LNYLKELAGKGQDTISKINLDTKQTREIYLRKYRLVRFRSASTSLKDVVLRLPSIISP